MPPILDSLEQLLLFVAGGIALWLGKVLKDRIKIPFRARREMVDELAKAEADNQELRESLYDHRNEMLRSGHWTRESLPPFTRSKRPLQ